MRHLCLLLALSACGPADVSDSDADTDNSDTDPTADTDPGGGTPAPEGGWPASSVCAETSEDHWHCTRVEAETWDRSATYTWSGGEFGEATVRDADGNTIVEVTSSNWIAVWGLSALPDGGWVLSGATLGGSISVNGATVDMPYAYDPFVVAVGPDGGLRWSFVREGISSDRTLVAARTDGSVALAGDLATETTLGDVELEGPSWVYDFFLAALDAGGEVLWAIEPPDAATSGDAMLETLALGDRSEIGALVQVRGTVSIAGSSVSGPEGMTPVPALAEADEDGVWLGIAER
jgi:hypothetical protein